MKSGTRTLAPWLLCGFLLSLSGAVLAEAENEWLEDYVLKDRAVALEQLIPGTADYYYYHALDALVGKRRADYEKFMADYRVKHANDGRIQRLTARAMVELYDTDENRAVTELIQRFALQFNHVKPGDRTAQAQYPSQLDAARVATRTLIDELKNNPARLGEVSAAGWILVFQATTDQRVKEALLYNCIVDPTVPGLIAEMTHLLKTGKVGFTNFKVTPYLTLPQLKELAGAVPTLMDDERYVNAYLVRLRSDRSPSIEEEDAQLDRQLAFAETLSPQFNSLKANLLFAKLRRNLELGVWDEALLKRFLAIPRQSPVIAAQFLQGDNARFMANPNQEWRSQTSLGPIGDDGALVTTYLEHFLADRDNPGEYAQFLDAAYLKRTFATAKILAGNVDAKFVGMLTEDEIKELRERVELKIAADNPRNFRLDEPVKLKLFLKNTPELIVKVYRINAFNYFKAKKSEVAADFDVMGLKADFEFAEKFDRPTTTRFELVSDRLAAVTKAAGVYVIDFLANGKNARAIVTKGRFFVVDETVSSGVILTVFDEDRKPVAEAKVHLDGHEYTTDADGRVSLPFAKQTAEAAVIVSKGEVCALDRFTHAAANYNLAGGIYVERESLLSRTRAKVIVSPRLLSYGNAVSVKHLVEPKLSIQAVDRNGVATTQTVDNLVLADDEDLVHEFTVPAYLANVTFTLSGKIALPWQDEKQELTLSRTINVSPPTEAIAIGAPYLTRNAQGLVLMLLGKNGEPIKSEAVAVDVSNRFLTRVVNLTLATNDQGEILLGELPDIANLATRVVSTGVRRSFALSPTAPIMPAKLYLEPGKDFALPFPTADLKKDDFRFFKLRQGINEADVIGQLEIGNGQLAIKGLAPGEYALTLTRTGQQVMLTVGKAEARRWLMVSEKSVMHSIPVSPLGIAGIDVVGNQIKIKVVGAGPGARVHVVGTFFRSTDSLLDAVRGNYDLPVWERYLPRFENLYLASRELDSEYRYILARKGAVKYPGNLLERPWLILNPVETQAVRTAWNDAEGGGVFGGRSGRGVAMKSYGGSARRQALAETGGASLEFLKDPAVVLTNLKPDQDGMVVVDAALFKNARNLVATALDPHGAVSLAKPLPGDRKLVTTDLRLGKVMDPAQAFGQATLARAVAKGGTISFRDRSSTEYQVIGTVAKLHRLLMALNPDIGLDEFAFLGRWHQLSDEEKQTQYSRYASHELDVFLAFKDAKFFDAVVKPYLKNKLHKTLVDEYLTGGSLERFRAPEERRNLNVFERILLEKSLGVKGAETARWIADQHDLANFPDEEIVRLIETALGSFGLERPAETRAELAEMQNGVAEEKTKERKLDRLRDAVAADMPAPAAPPIRPAAKPMMAEMTAAADKADADGFFAEGEVLEKAAPEPKQQYFRNVDRTKEYMEMGYFRKAGEPIPNDAELVGANPFWADFATAEAKPVLSSNVFYAHRSRTEALLALALTDLPFESKDPVEKGDGVALEVAVAGNAIVFSREIAPLAGAATDEASPLMISIRYFLLNDGQTYRPGETPKPATEFLPGRSYYADITVTNPTATARKCDVLYQVPAGTIVFNQKENVKNLKLTLQPYGTFNHRFIFYFPATGEFQHYPTEVYEKNRLIAATGLKTLKVVATLTEVDRESWDWIALNGSDDEVIRFLANANLGRLILDKIYFRLASKPFYTALADLLAQRQAYDAVVASYAFRHKDLPGMRNYLKRSPLATEIDGFLDAKLLTLDPVADGLYRHLEYSPLIIPRTHVMKGEPTLFIDNLKVQYRSLLDQLATKPAINDAERLQLAYYFLLQNRVEEAMALVAAVKPGSVDMKLQHDYLMCYLDFFREDVAGAKQIAAAYQDFGVPRWRDRFREVLAEIAEVEGGIRPDAAPSRESQLATMAGTETTLDFKVDNGKVLVSYENAHDLRMNLYEMDVEVLFSRNPFAKNYAERFAFVQPSKTIPVLLEAKGGKTEIDIPAEFRNRDIFVELVAGNVTQAKLALSTNLDVNTYQNSGRIKVVNRDTRKPLAKIYVKVYALCDGQTEFYKDGYTDLRGIFDYATLSDDKIDRTEKFAVLVLSDTEGSVILETAPPKQ